MTTPAEVITAIWEKASSLLTEPNAIVSTPGCDPCSRMVKSSSGQRPHIMVTKKKTGQYCCDGTCPNWKSLGICSHTVAAAEDNCDLQSFVTWFAKEKNPNITQLAMSQMPAGCGRKGGIPPRKRRKLVPAESRKSFFDILPSTASQKEPVNACPASHQNLSQEPVSIAFPCRSSIHHMNVSVSGSASVNFGAPVMTAVLPSSPPPLIQALPQKPVPSL